jgi:NAD(P)-dependent dehydrogenase (short-subunit alcohol dehydrogenase family)
MPSSAALGSGTVIVMNTRRGGLAVLDTVLDRAVIPGYTRFGYRLRQPGWAHADPPPDALRGRTALVTGANSGIGKAITAGLAAHGAAVVMAVRDRDRGEQARAELTAADPEADLRVEICDVADLAAVRAFAADLSGRLPRLDVLVHNAGVLPAIRTETGDGHEITLATHVLGPVLLTELLAPTLADAGDPRVILMSSGGMYTQALPADDPEYRTGRYRGVTAYARTKRIQVALTPILADRWAPQGISVYCMHPGWTDTPGVADSLPGFRRLTGPVLRSPAQGADTAVWLAATEPAPPTGLFWHDRRPRPEHYLPFTKESNHDRRLLWRYCAQAVGIDDP